MMINACRRLASIEVIICAAKTRQSYRATIKYQEGERKPLNQAEYMALAEFRYQLRRFLRNMEEKSRDAGLNPQQYQLLLAIKGLPRQQSPTISALAERMQLNHNSTVELVDRCEERGLVSRLRTGSDRRHVTLSITPEGDVLLQRLATAARQEL